MHASQIQPFSVPGALKQQRHQFRNARGRTEKAAMAAHVNSVIAAPERALSDQAG